MANIQRRPCGRSIDERTIVHFADNPKELIEAYVESGEGLDRAGGFAVQVRHYEQIYDVARLTDDRTGSRRRVDSQSGWRLSKRRRIPSRIVLQILGIVVRRGR